MDKIFKVGVIGLGNISRMHIPALMSTPKAKITAVCDIREDRLKHGAEITGAIPYTDWRELITSDIDVVHILTPHYLHAPMAIAALKVGKHVLTEKPMASTIEDAIEMIKNADSANGTLSVIFQNRYNPSTVALKKIIDSGEVGKLKCARASVCWHRDAAYYADGPWRGKLETSGGGSLINQCIHTLDLLSYLGGPIKRVRGHVSTDVLDDIIEVEDNTHAVFEYESGVMGVLHTTNSYGADSPVVIEFIFENGIYQIWADKLFKIEDGLPVLIADGESTASLGEKSYWGNSHKIQIAKYYDCLAAGKKFEIDGRSAFPAFNLVKAICKSSQTGNWVELIKP